MVRPAGRMRRRPGPGRTRPLSGLALGAGALLLVACGGGGSGTLAQVQVGGELFRANCAGCHGAGAEGVRGSGRDLRDSELVQAHSTMELVGFLQAGRGEGHPESLTGREMPPRGGAESLTDKDLRAISRYLESLQPGG